MLALRIFVPFALGYFLSFLFRTINVVVGPRLIDELALEPQAIGLLTSDYFFTFAAAQVPLGVALDRFGPRKTEAFLLIFAAAGAFFFALADDTQGLAMARGLIGLGVSACLMASFKAFVLWYPKERLPLLNGCILAVGGLGAIMATSPAEAALELTGWRNVFLGLAGATLLASALVFMLVPEKASAQPKETLAQTVKGLWQVVDSRLFWRVAPLTFTGSAMNQSFQGLWAGPWLRDLGGYSASETARLVLASAVALTAGFLLMGAMTARLIRLGFDPLKIAAAGIAVAQVTQLGLVFGWTDAALPLMVTMSFFGTAGTLFYAALVPAYPTGLSGRVSTANNLFAFAGAFAGQWATGLVIGAFTGPGQPYAPIGYTVAFALLFGLQVASLAWLASGFRRLRTPG